MFTAIGIIICTAVCVALVRSFILKPIIKESKEIIDLKNEIKKLKKDSKKSKGTK